ncbi:PREDICTED: leucine-zipper-like transcriptional regulator 1 [Tinamus guttatus]|uniref:leucine-zipper-like transcriptional regulator 1 n=1 Tax=Tinamus guttatus TaxID=94827 RepID=UPI00052EA625|nr:PREDICTED: leucine-zipper-like transcriptional regulator 1 [Tinamus guttatus]
MADLRSKRFFLAYGQHFVYCQSVSPLSCLPPILLYVIVFKSCNQVSHPEAAERVSAPEEAPSLPSEERGLKKSRDVFALDFGITAVKQPPTTDSEVNKVTHRSLINGN